MEKQEPEKVGRNKENVLSGKPVKETISRIKVFLDLNKSCWVA